MDTPRALPVSPLFTKRALASAREALHRTSQLQEILKNLQDSVGLEGRTRAEIKLLSGTHPHAFARRYMIKNMVKCAISVEYFSDTMRKVRRLIDLGTGPGTFLIPFASILKNAELVGIDRSRAALHLASRLFDAANLPQPLLLHGHVPQTIASGGHLFTASYLLAEFDADELSSFTRWAGARLDASFLIVDYVDVILEAAAQLGAHRPCNVKAFRFQLPIDIAGAVDDDEISFGAIFVEGTKRGSGGLPKRVVFA